MIVDLIWIRTHLLRPVWSLLQETYKYDIIYYHYAFEQCI